MSFTQVVPGMKSGSTIRNIIIAILYLSLIPFWPFIAAYVVATNRGGAAQSLSSVPGISENGGVVAGVVVFIGTIVLLGVVAAAVPGGDTDTTNDGADVESTEGSETTSSVGDGPTDESGSDGGSTAEPDDSTSDGTDGGGSDDSTSDGTDGGGSDDSTSDGTDGGGSDDSTSDGTDSGSNGSTSDSTDGGSDDSTSDGTDGGSDDSTSDGTDGGSDDSTSDGTDDSTNDGSDGSSGDSSTEDDSPPPAPDGESYQFDGSGNDVTDGFAAEGGLVTIAFEHDGESNFQVQAVDSDGNQKYLVNEIGDYDGTVALNMAEKDWRLDVTADGDWSATVEQPRFNEADVKALPAETSGEHAAWFGPYEFDGSQEVTFEIQSDDQAAVWLQNTEGRNVDLLHNEIGPYEGSALVTDSGYGLIVVDTDSAEWRIEITE